MLSIFVQSYSTSTGPVQCHTQCVHSVHPVHLICVHTHNAFSLSCLLSSVEISSELFPTFDLHNDLITTTSSTVLTCMDTNTKCEVIQNIIKSRYYTFIRKVSTIHKYSMYYLLIRLMGVVQFFILLQFRLYVTFDSLFIQGEKQDT